MGDAAHHGSGGEVVVGVPTWCESAHIERHTRHIDAALSVSGLRRPAVIVNADNTSPDGTAETFLATATCHRKATLATPRGKGSNEQALFRYALDVDAAVLVTLDADLEIVPSDWIPALAGPVLDGAADIVIPLYARFWYDGTITNQLVAPLVLGVTGEPIRQPIGGDFAFAPAALYALLSEPWPSAALGFGWDVHMVVTALSRRLRYQQARLSHGKLHSLRSDTPDQIEREMAVKFAETARGTLLSLAPYPPPTSSEVPAFPSAPALTSAARQYDLHAGNVVARQRWHRHAASPWTRLLLGDHVEPDGDPPPLDDGTWAKVLVRALEAARHAPPSAELVASLQTLYLLRLMRELPSYLLRTPREVDVAVHSLATQVRRELIVAAGRGKVGHYG